MLEEYPISTVNALSKAAIANRIYEQIAMSGAVAAGAVHAVEAGFGGKAPKALKKYQQSMMGQIKKLKVKGQGQKQDAETLLSGFGGLGKAERRVRHKDNT